MTSIEVIQGVLYFILIAAVPIGALAIVFIRTRK